MIVLVTVLLYILNLNIVLSEPLQRTKRQSPGVNAICVPKGLCTLTSGPGIDPRIVAPGEVKCGENEEICVGVANQQCGVRYVPNISNANGLTVNGAHPWLAYMTNETGYSGNGVLIDASHVLTAAHKVVGNKKSPDKLRICLGVFNPGSLATAECSLASKIVEHPSYNATYLKNDIAVITLATPMKLGYRINVACASLATNTASFVGKDCLVAGWGETSFGANNAPTNPQKQINVPVVSYQTCLTSMQQSNVLGSNAPLYLDQNEICAGGKPDIDACTQDGGSPLMCQDGDRFVVAGLVIWGKGCGREGVYGVYVDPSKYFNDFIKANI